MDYKEWLLAASVLRTVQDKMAAPWIPGAAGHVIIELPALPRFSPGLKSLLQKCVPGPSAVRGRQEAGLGRL